MAPVVNPAGGVTADTESAVGVSGVLLPEHPETAANPMNTNPILAEGVIDGQRPCGSPADTFTTPGRPRNCVDAQVRRPTTGGSVSA